MHECGEVCERKLWELRGYGDRWLVETHTAVSLITINRRFCCKNSVTSFPDEMALFILFYGTIDLFQKVCYNILKYIVKFPETPNFPM